MSSILKWAVGKVSDASNSAVEAIARHVVTRFLDEPPNSETLSLEMFENWTIKLTLRKVFLAVKLINPYVDFLVFNSIYISDLRANAAYSLTKLGASIDRIVIDIDARKPEVKVAPDEDLTASIRVLKEQMPEQTQSGGLAWLMAPNREIKAQLKNLTAIFRVPGHEDALSVVVENLNADFKSTPELFLAASLNGVSLISGEKKRKRIVASVKGIYTNVSSSKAILRVESVDVTVDEKVLQTLGCLVDFFPKSSPSSQPMALPVIDDITLEIKMLSVKTSNGISVVVSGAKVTMKGLIVSVSVQSLRITSNDITVFESESEDDPFISAMIRLTLPGIEKELFNTFPNHWSSGLEYARRSLENHGTLAIKLILSSFTARLSKDFITSVFDVVSWFSVFSPPKKAQRINLRSKTSISLYAKLPTASISFLDANITLRNLTLNLIQGTTPSTQNLGLLATLEDASLSLSKQFRLLTRLPSEAPGISVLFSRKSSLGVDPKMYCEAKVDNFLVSYIEATDIIQSIANEIASMIIEPDPHTSSTPQKASLLVKAEVNNVLLDFCAKNVAARLIGHLQSATASLDIDLETVDIEGMASVILKTYISNSRASLPINAYTNLQEYCGFYSLVPLFDINIEGISVDSKEGYPHLNIPRVLVTGGFCVDSVRILIALILHVQFGLDLPPEKIPIQQIAKNPRILLSKDKILENEELLNDPSTVATHHPIDVDGPPAGLSPTAIPFLSLSIKDVSITVRFYGGTDLPLMADQRIIDCPPPVLDHEAFSDYEILSERDYSNALEVRASISLDVTTYTNQPVQANLAVKANVLEVLDISQEDCERCIILQKQSEPTRVIVDVFTSDSFRSYVGLNICLGSFDINIRQSQIKFLIDTFTLTFPGYPSFDIVCEPVVFQNFKFSSGQIKVSAKFRLWMDVNIDNIAIRPRPCKFYGVRGPPDLIGRLIPFYLQKIRTSDVAPLLRSLPVIKNFMRIGSALTQVFTYDVSKYGFFAGLAHSTSSLLRVLVMELLNTSATITELTERVLQTAISFSGGKEDLNEAMKYGYSALTGRTKHRLKKSDSFESGKISIPTLVLTPGVIVIRSTTEMLKRTRDYVDPDDK